MGCSKRKAYNCEEKAPRQGARQRRRQATNCQWKAYACWKDGNWYLRMEEPEQNHPASAPEVFPSNRTFSPADIIVIKDDLKAHIPPIKTLARLHNLNAGKYFTMRDLHNARAKIFWQELAYLTPIQHLLQEFQTSNLWSTSHLVDGYEQLTHLFFAFEPSLDLFEMYPDIFFINCTYKTNKYNMSLCIFNGVTACNKSFYIGFALL